LLYHILPKKKIENRDEDDENQDNENTEPEWLPSMNLYELIQQIPDFISEILLALKTNEEAPMVGKFYLGLQYDYQQIWM
jgi:hypothetical protein